MNGAERHEPWQLSRRELLVLTGAGVLLAGCSTLDEVQQPPRIHTVTELVADRPFYVAHRGSQDNWPEHTAEAYRQSVEHGAKAIEVSVHATADGVLVCHHDDRTFRMTGEDVDIADATYRDLESLSNNARDWLGPGSQLLPIPKLEVVLAAHADTHVIFLEDKQGTNTTALLDLMDTFKDSQAHFVWKLPGTSGRYAEAAGRGYKTWGYFTAEEFPQLAEFAGNFDYLGINHAATDEEIVEACGYGKPVICWEVHTRSERDRVVGLGVAGIMCANIPYVMTDGPRETADRFVTGTRAAGDLPFALAWTHQPTITPDSSSIVLGHPDKTSYCMGSMCPIVEESYTLSCEMRWPEKLPQDSEHAGIAFGQRDDSVYRVREPSAVGGYHLILRPDGTVELLGRQSGEVSGYNLGTIQSPAPQSGQWVRFQVTVTPESITFGRVDLDGGSDWTATTDSTTYRGGYFWLCRNYDGVPPVEFRSVSVKPAGVPVASVGRRRADA
ncbi:glycerophosphodiester phosphodiesterase [Arthrobacter sp. CAN_A1]|uniref:glycerophosphodiester phosphodiesterase n=1 Tax=Arthrobacter sp. CAN_A1 TaxID=2787717 RepID=UPI0018C94E26